MAPCKLFGRPLSRPPQARDSQSLIWSAAVAASRGQDLTSAVETGYMSSVGTGQMSAVETGQMSAAETGQISAVETRQMSSVETRRMSIGKTGRCPFSLF